MDKLERAEKVPEFDFIDENNVVTFAIDRDALPHLPTISEEDRQTGRERFRILLGGAEIRGRHHAHITVSGVLEMTEEEGDVYGLYREGIEEITYDPQKIRIFVDSLRKNPQYSIFEHLGDIHTHPASLAAYPSHADLEGSVNQYKNGIVSPDKPYIFGIAGMRENGGMEYNFYRIVRVGEGYGFKLLNE